MAQQMAEAQQMQVWMQAQQMAPNPVQMAQAWMQAPQAWMQAPSPVQMQAQYTQAMSGQPMVNQPMGACYVSHMTQPMLQPMLQPMQPCMPQLVQPPLPPTHHSPPCGHVSGRVEPTRAPTSLVSLAKEKEGSKQLQDRLARMSGTRLQAACDELGPHLLELSKHQYGNYVASKLAALPAAHVHLLAAMKGHVVSLAQGPQGSRVLQAALGALPPAGAAALVSELEGHVCEVSLDTNGSWGVCVAFEATCAPFILEEVSRGLHTLATHQHGVRVAQRVMKAAAAAGMSLHPIGNALVASGDISTLATHRFGNYVVQVALRHCATEQRAQLLTALLPQTLALSSSKHGSNVAEQLLNLATNAQLAPLSDRVFSSVDEKPLRDLMGNEFGNYVLQTLLRRLEPAARAHGLQCVEDNTAVSNFGRTILAAAH